MLPHSKKKREKNYPLKVTLHVFPTPRHPATPTTKT